MSDNHPPKAILRIAIPSPLRGLFDYLPDRDYAEQQLRPGLRVSIPFGKQKAIVGILIEVVPSSVTPMNKLRKIHGITDQQGLTPDILSLCQWCADYYHYPLGEVCHLALPVKLRKPEPAASRTYPTAWQLSSMGKACEKHSFGRAQKQYAAWKLAQQHTIITPELIKNANINRAVINVLLEKGILEIASTDQLCSHHTPTAPALPLNPEQQQALDTIKLDRYNTYLLDGITGSGKTEVYLQSIQVVLNQGKQVLVLVPEIGLTPQTLSRFQQRFNLPIGILHSGITDRQRLNTWLAAKAGDIPIIIGTRSAVFTPLPNIGLIVVDEEHDLSYKQQEGVRYSARELAIIRARKNNIPVILGSATPSLETLQNALSNRFVHLHLRQRATQMTLSDIRCVDQPQHGIAPEILTAMQNALAKQQQVLIFINRRGYSPTLICQECGWLSQCNRCDSNMTVHHFRQPKQYLHCHHCDYKTQIPLQCPHCHSRHLLPLGEGTQRIEETLLQQFDQTPIIRIDRDSMSRKGQIAATLDTIQHTNACILVGTQMLAKGHHFPNVSLAVILGLDNSFFSSDFRGTERMAQLLTQVAGRAGREKYQGQVFVQTRFANHPHLQTLINQGYSVLATQLLSERQVSGMPPFQHLALIRCHAQQAAMALSFLQQVRFKAEHCRPSSNDLQYLGPVASSMEKRNNRYYYQLQIKSRKRKILHGLLHQLLPQLETLHMPKGLRWLVDVDPQES